MGLYKIGKKKRQTSDGVRFGCNFGAKKFVGTFLGLVLSFVVSYQQQEVGELFAVLFCGAVFLV